jgi:hypothetical protein
MWSFVQANQVVLSIPGLRDLELSADDARAIGEMLIEHADEASRYQPALSLEPESEPDNRAKGRR